jgi:hypothetical protein
MESQYESFSFSNDWFLPPFNTLSQITEYVSSYSEKHYEPTAGKIIFKVEIFLAKTSKPETKKKNFVFK